jgi:hypothetical protein
VEYEILKEREVGSIAVLGKDLGRHSLDGASTTHPNVEVYEIAVSTSSREGLSAWNFGNCEDQRNDDVPGDKTDGPDKSSDCERYNTKIEITSHLQFLWMPVCDTLSNPACLFSFWFDTGWQGIETEEFLTGYRCA